MRRRSTPRLLTGVGCSLAIGSIAAAPALAHTDPVRPKTVSGAEEADKPSATQTRELIEINLPLYISGGFAADIAVQARNDGSVETVDEERLIALLTPYLAPEPLAALKARAVATPDRWLPLDDASVDGLVVGFDPATLQLAVRIDAAATTARELSLGGGRATDTLPADTIYPADFSAGVNLTIAQRWINDSRDNPELEGLDPLTGGIDGFVNVGGIDGVYLFHQWTYDGGAESEFQRGPLTAIKDFRASAIRVAVGDIDPLGTFLQGPASLGGVQVATAYAEIQPNRNVRPSGRTRFVLERPAQVEVVINGVPVRTLQLGAGQYDVRDFSFSEGVNDVRLYIEDAAGRREVAAFSAFFSSTLLDQGINDFSFSTGFEREATPGGYRYLTDSVQATGYFRRGVTSNLTLGVNAQAGRDLANAGVEAVVATGFGTFVGQANVSRADGRSGFASSIGYRLIAGPVADPIEVEAVWDYRSRDYRALNEFQTFNLEAHEASLRVRKTLFGNFGISASVGYLDRRDAPDAVRYSASASRSFGRVTANLLFDGTRDDFTGNRDSVLISLNYRFGARSTVRAQYRSRFQEKSIEYERAIRNVVGDIGLRAGIFDAEDRRSFEGQADLITNRGEFGVRTERIETLNGGDRLQVTTARAAFGFGIADGAFAFGRPFSDGFAIVRKHPTLSDSEVHIGSSNAGVADIARTGAYGPAFASTYRAYDLQTLSTEVSNAPVGYDLGAARYNLFPGAASGFNIVVGSDAANTALGTLVDAEGAPIALKSGELRPVGGVDATPLPFFTNRAGRFVAEKLRPGTYRMFIGGRDLGVEIVVPRDARGLVETGQLVVRNRP